MESQNRSKWWVSSEKGVLAWLLKELEYKRCHTEDGREYNQRNDACNGHSWDKLVSHIDDDNRYHEREESKCDDPQWQRDNPQDCSEDEIDDCEYNGEEECRDISVTEGDTFDEIRLCEKVYSSCSDEEVNEVHHNSNGGRE